MGADLLLAVWTTTAKCDTENMITAIEKMPEWQVLSLDSWTDSSAYVYESLVSAVEDYVMVLDERHRYGNLLPAGPGRFVAISGAASWGDDPYAGWSGLVLLLEACEVNEGLASAAGYIGGGICCGTLDGGQRCTGE